jgi:hypothetical protein
MNLEFATAAFNAHTGTGLVVALGYLTRSIGLAWSEVIKAKARLRLSEQGIDPGSGVASPGEPKATLDP